MANEEYFIYVSSHICGKLIGDQTLGLLIRRLDKYYFESLYISY